MAKKQNKNATLGYIGETYAQMQIRVHGGDVFNANYTYNNYASIDLVCINRELPETEKPWKPRTAFVQVKTTKEKAFPTGFTIDQCLDKEFLNENVLGPWVFIAMDSLDDLSSVRCYVLTREQVIKLAYESHDWYKNKWKREKDIQGTAVAALQEEWLYGEIKKCEGATPKHPAFENPLKGEHTLEAWDNIWKD